MVDIELMGKEKHIQGETIVKIQNEHKLKYKT
jgi:hypothetical protein